jgi:SAM-dependent methyltransferase
MFKDVLAHPLARGVDLDDPRATVLRKRILQEKQFLRHIYDEWYQLLVASMPRVRGPVLELGTGAGFLKDYLPELITSDVLSLPDIGVVLDAHRIPFQDASLRAIVMIDVLHHLSQPAVFFAEATRCVKPGGGMIMIEPWVTPWSRLVHTWLHHEPFRPEASRWGFPTSGPLSGANGALPWMIFHRDRSRFTADFPEWRVKTIDLDMPFSYLLSGGVSMRAFAPGAAYKPVRWLETRQQRWIRKCAMFARIWLERTDD